MGRPITQFTRQRIYLSLNEPAQFAKETGYDGLELACWDNHINVGKVLTYDGYKEKEAL